MYERNQKYNKIKEIKNTISIKLDIVQLQLFCNFIVSDNESIHKSNIINMSKVFDSLDMRLYQNDIDKLKKIEFIKKGIEARLHYNLAKKDLILMHIKGGLLYDDNLDIQTEEINNEEIAWLNSIIAEALNFGHMYGNINKMQEICNKFNSGDYENKISVLNEFKNEIFNIQNKFRQSDSNASTDLTFSLKQEKFEDCVRQVHGRVTSPSNTLITGLVGMNELLGGGYNTGRVYAFLGLPSEGKSITLLDMALQIKKYNPGYICKDPTKKPCVVYLTLENSLDESVVRLCEMVGIEGSMSDYTPDELISKLRTEGELYVNSASPIDLIIKFRPGMSEDTSYLYKMTEELEDEGYEVIAVLLDYIKRIRSTLDNSDTRYWLGNVINECNVYAKAKQAVVITASQLNRDATHHIDESRKANKNDLVRMLGRSQIGESMLILENLDGAFIIAPEWDENRRKYLGIQRIKKRYKASDLTYLYYPYQSEIKLLEDFNAIEPVYRTTMKDMPSFVPNSSQYNTVKEINSLKLMAQPAHENILSGSISCIDDTPELICPVKRITV